MMGKVIDLRSGEPIYCLNCDNDTWKIYVKEDDNQRIFKIRCTNCMSEVKANFCGQYVKK